MLTDPSLLLKLADQVAGLRDALPSAAPPAPPADPPPLSKEAQDLVASLGAALGTPVPPALAQAAQDPASRVLLGKLVMAALRPTPLGSSTSPPGSGMMSETPTSPNDVFTQSLDRLGA